MKTFRQTNRKLIARTTRIEAPPDLVGMLPTSGGYVWISNNRGFVGWGQAVRIDPGMGPGRFDRAAADLDQLFDGTEVDDEVDRPGTGPIAFGSFTFDPNSTGSAVVVPEVVVGFDGEVSWMTVCEVDEAAPRDRTPQEELQSETGTTQAHWIDMVDKALGSISRGDLEKVVLARVTQIESPVGYSLRETVRNLSAQYPECFTFEFEDLVGASPELLVRCQGSVLESMVLAGSAARGAGAAEDDALGASLLGSDKDQREHAIVVEQLIERVGRICRSIKTDLHPELFKLSNVQHLRTRIHGQLTTALSALEAAGHLHPTAAVCGIPAPAAIAAIRQLEGFDRGRYAGPVGWVDEHGDGEWAVALRCAEVRGGVARAFAGCGIVAGSDPILELKESDLKLQAIVDALSV